MKDKDKKDKNEGKELQIFQSHEFGRVRTTVVDGEPWFVASDVADALGYRQRGRLQGRIRRRRSAKDSGCLCLGHGGES